MATIKDVAVEAKVSIATVSNAINGKIHVSDDKYSRVMAAIKKLQYNPSLMASNLRNNQLRIIAYVVPELSPLYVQIFQGISDKANALGFSIIVRTTAYDLQVEDDVLDELSKMHVKGVFISTCNGKNSDRISYYKEMGLLFVFIDSYVDHPSFSYVRFSNAFAVRTLVEKIVRGKNSDLISKILLLAGPEQYLNENDCVRGFLEAIPQITEKQIARIRMRKELGFIDLVDIFVRLHDYPEFIVASSEVFAEIAAKVSVLFNKSVEIYYLSGESTTYNHKCSEYALYRYAVSLGNQAIHVMLELLQKPLIYENKHLTVGIYETGLEKAAEYISGSGRLNVCMLSGTQSNALIKLIHAYNEQYSADIQYSAFSSDELYEKIIESEPSDNHHFDIYMVDYQWLNQLSLDKYLLPMDDFIGHDKDEFINNFNDNIQQNYIYYSDHIYTLPYLITMQALFYRKDLFEDHDIRRSFLKEFGVPLNTPKNWTEFAHVAKFFTREFNNMSPVKYGTTFYGLDRISILQEYFPRQYAYKGKFISSDGKFSFNTSANRRALMNLCTTYAYTPMNELETNVVNAQEWSRILNNQVAMYFTFATHIPIQPISSSFPVNHSNIDIAPMSGAMRGGWNLGISRHSGKPRESYHFIKWILSDRIAVDATLLGSIVPKDVVFRSYECNRLNPSIAFLQKEFSNAIQRENLRINGEKSAIVNSVYDILAKYIYKAMVKEINEDDALDSISNEVGCLSE